MTKPQDEATYTFLTTGKVLYYKISRKSASVWLTLLCHHYVLEHCPESVLPPVTFSIANATCSGKPGSGMDPTFSWGSAMSEGWKTAREGVTLIAQVIKLAPLSLLQEEGEVSGACVGCGLLFRQFRARCQRACWESWWRTVEYYKSSLRTEV